MNRIFWLVIAACCGGPASAQNAQTTPVIRSEFFPAAKSYAAEIEDARKLARELQVKQGIPGLSVAVAINGKAAWAEGFGFADSERGAAATPRSVYRLGSVSKLLTTATLARLVEQRKLDLDAPIQRYVPDFPDKGAMITSRQLAGHLAGIRHYSGNEFFNTQAYGSVREALARFASDPLLHPPGTKYFYSSYGYVLLSAAIEAACRQDFLSCVHKHVLRQLRMKSTFPDRPGTEVKNKVRFYVRDTQGALQEAPKTDVSDRWAAGGFLSSVEDLVRFGSAQIEGGFFKASTRTLLFTSQRTADTKETSVGLGWRIGKDAAGRMFVHHGGQSMGGRAFLLVYPEQKVVVALLANVSFARFAEKEAQEIAQLFLTK